MTPTQALSKRKSHAFGKDVYLLGRNEYGKLLWLEAPKWDCDWYWGFGYVEVYTNQKRPERAKDITSHSHYNGLVGMKNDNGEYVHHLNKSPRMQVTVLTDHESWELADLMQQFYTLKEAAAIFHTGSAHVSTPKISSKNPELARIINQEILPKIFARVIEILTPTEGETQQ